MMPRNFDDQFASSDGEYLDISSDDATSGTITIPGLSFEETFATVPGEITRIRLPSDVSVLTSEEIEARGIRVTADDPVTIYGLSRKQFTTDGFLALPRSILATQYLIASYTSLQSLSNLSQFAVVSPRDAVEVTITPAAPTLSGQAVGTPFTVTLDRGDVYQVRSSLEEDVDLTGSVVQSSLPVAVFSGHSCANIPVGVGFCDILVEQLPPTDTWGSRFVTRPLERRLNGDTFRILAGQDGTEVRINGALVETLGFGDYYETQLESAAVIETSAPSLVMQYSNGDQFDPERTANGDPFMMLIPPTEQFLDRYTFTTPDEGFALNLVSVIAPTQEVGSLRLDGAAVDPDAFSPVPGSDISTAAFDLATGPHTLESTTGAAFGIYSYGFDDDDSYGYTGGLGLEFISEGSGPQIDRTPETLALEASARADNAAIEVSATITDPAEPFVQDAFLYYRTVGTSSFTRLPMTAEPEDRWTASIPAADVQEPGIEYYLQATDGRLTATSPRIDAVRNPYAISVLPNEPPAIRHRFINATLQGNPLPVLARISDPNDEIQSAEVLYRVPGGNPAYTAVTMTQQASGSYVGVIEARAVTDRDLEYFLRAEDSFGVARTQGSSDDPIVVNVTRIPAPDLRTDALGDRPVATTVGLRWSPLGETASYRVQVAPDTLFRSLVADTSVSDIGHAVAGLEQGTTYAWRVRGETTDDVGIWSRIQTFRTHAPEIAVDLSRSFDDPRRPQNYQLLAVPGSNTIPLRSTLQGAPGTDWQAYWDTGADTDFWVAHDASSTFDLEPGRGFWVLSSTDWRVTETVDAPDLDADGAVSIPVHDGWNIISNPFDQTIPWSSVAAATGGDLQPLWSWNGRFTQIADFESAGSGAAFYFFNDRELPELRLPYPGSPLSRSTEAPESVQAQTAMDSAEDVSFTLGLMASDRTLSSVQIGLLDDARRPPQTTVAPPDRFAPGSLHILPETGGDSSPRRNRLSAIRAPLGAEGRVFDLMARSLRPGTIDVIEGRPLPVERAVLVNPSTGQQADLTAGEALALPGGEETSLRLILGTPTFVQSQTPERLPAHVRVSTYPNPARGRTTVQVSLPAAGGVTVSIFDVLGRRISVLADARLAAGTHRLTWDPDTASGSLSSGLYLVRLETETGTHTAKMTILR